MTIHLMDAAADEDSLLVVADYISNILNEGQAKTALAETPGSKFMQDAVEAFQQQRLDAYASILLAHVDNVISKSSAQDAECVANVLVHAISRSPADKQPQLVQSYAVAVTSKLDERSEERLCALLNLYGALHASPMLQRQVLLTAAEYARRGPGLARILVPAVRGKSSEWIQQWGLNDAQSRELLVALANLVKAGADRASVKEYQRLVGCALQLAREGDAAAIAQVQPLAVAAIVDFVRSPSLFQADWASSPAVKALASDAKHKPLYNLFAAVLSGDMASFKAAATPAALEAAGTTMDAAQSKARLVALLATCSSSSSQEVPFASLASALDVGPGGVESWVVRAIGAKLLDAKIDQVREVVVVSRCTQRTFGPAEWSTLEAQLASWRDALRGVTQMIAAQKSNGVGAAAATAAAQTSRPSAVRA